MRDPAGEQEARFDLYHGAGLISRRDLQRELLYAQEPGTSVALFIPHQVAEEESKITYPTFPSSSEYRANQSRR